MLQIASAPAPLDPHTWAWDVYSFLLASLLVCRLLDRAFRARRWLIPVLLAPMFISDGIWQALATQFAPDSSFVQFLIGHPHGEFDGWNLVPWLGLPTALFLMGRENGERWLRSPEKLRVSRNEVLLWGVTLIALFWQYDPRYPVPLGPSFDAFVFHLEPLYFWPQFSVFLFLLRLGLDSRVNQWLAQTPVVSPLSRGVSHLAWCRHFGWCYLVQILLFLSVGQDIYNWNQNPEAFNFLWLGVFLAAEVSVSLAFYLAGLRKRPGDRQIKSTT